MSNNSNGVNPLWIIWIIVFFMLINSKNDDDDPSPPPASDEQKEASENVVEGVIHRLIPSENDITIVVFTDGRQKELYLGNHKVYIGEWNQLRVNSRGAVEEVWFGEGSMEDEARGW